MEILRAIERADELCPNPYTLEEKICWCDEVTAELRRSVIKVYETIETDISEYGEVNLPDDIPFERIELAFVGNHRLDKQDLRSFKSNPQDLVQSIGGSKKLRIVYLDLPKPTRMPDIRGEFNTGGNTIEIEEAPFIEGDAIEIAYLPEDGGEPEWESSEQACVIEVDSDKIILDRDAVEPQTAASLAIRRIVDDVTAIDEAPYDGMYVEYILAKAALYQHDYVGYSAHMTQYNSLLDMLRREVRSRGPMTEMSRFRNYSCL